MLIVGHQIADTIYCGYTWNFYFYICNWLLFCFKLSYKFILNCFKWFLIWFKSLTSSEQRPFWNLRSWVSSSFVEDLRHGLLILLKICISSLKYEKYSGFMFQFQGLDLESHVQQGSRFWVLGPTFRVPSFMSQVPPLIWLPSLGSLVLLFEYATPNMVCHLMNSNSFESKSYCRSQFTRHSRNVQRTLSGTEMYLQTSSTSTIECFAKAVNG